MFYFIYDVYQLVWLLVILLVDTGKLVSRPVIFDVIYSVANVVTATLVHDVVNSVPNVVVVT